MAADFEEWFNSWRCESWNNEAETSVLESYLEGSLTPEEAAEQITAPTPDRRLSASAKEQIWNLFFACATNCPEAHPALIELIRAITILPKPTNRNQVDWTDQRTPFGELWRGNFDSLLSELESKYVLQHGSPSVSTAQKWINFNAFSAAFEAANIFPLSVIEKGVYVIIDALEKKSATDKQLGVRIPAASQWLIHTSRIMLVNAKSFGTTLWGESESELWKGKTGFSKERWDFWKERMEKMSTKEQLSDEAREFVRRSVVAMGKAERAKK